MVALPRWDKRNHPILNKTEVSDSALSPGNLSAVVSFVHAWIEAVPDPCKSYLSTPPRSDPSFAVSTESPLTPSVRAEDSMEGESTSFPLNNHYTNTTILLEKARDFSKVSGFFVACNFHLETIVELRDPLPYHFFCRQCFFSFPPRDCIHALC